MQMADLNPGSKTGSQSLQDSVESQISEAYVAFIDILGFSQRINALFARSTSLEEVKKDPLIDALNSAREFASRKIFSRSGGTNLPKLSVISDSIIIYAPPEIDGLFFIINAITTLTYKLMKRGVLIRGAVA